MDLKEVEFKSVVWIKSILREIHWLVLVNTVLDPRVP
jgi:hypothetical protein